MFHYKDNEFLKEYFGFFALPFILIGFYLLLRNNFVVRYSIAKEYYEYYLTNMHNEKQNANIVKNKIKYDNIYNLLILIFVLAVLLCIIIQLIVNSNIFDKEVLKIELQYMITFIKILITICVLLVIMKSLNNGHEYNKTRRNIQKLKKLGKLKQYLLSSTLQKNILQLLIMDNDIEITQDIQFAKSEKSNNDEIESINRLVNLQAKDVNSNAKVILHGEILHICTSPSLDKEIIVNLKDVYYYGKIIQKHAIFIIDEELAKICVNGKLILLRCDMIEYWDKILSKNCLIID